MVVGFKAEGKDRIDGIGCIEAGDFENSIRRAKALKYVETGPEESTPPSIPSASVPRLLAERTCSQKEPHRQRRL